MLPREAPAQGWVFCWGCQDGSQEFSEPSFDVAGGGNKLILEIHLCESFVTGPSQPVTTHYIADGPLDRISLVHLQLKFFALLVASSLLQAFVVSSHQNRAMGLSARHAGRFMPTVMTLAAKLKTVGDLTAFVFAQFATVGARLALGADRLALANADIKGFDPIWLSSPARAALGCAGPSNCQPSSLACSIARPEM